LQFKYLLSSFSNLHSPELHQVVLLERLANFAAGRLFQNVLNEKGPGCAW